MEIREKVEEIIDSTWFEQTGCGNLAFSTKLAQKIADYITTNFISKERLLNKGEIANALCNAVFMCDLKEDKPAMNLELYGIAEYLLIAQEKKIKEMGDLWQGSLNI